MALNMSHIKGGGHSLLRIHKQIIGDMSPVPPVSAPMSQGNLYGAGGGVNAKGVAKYSDFGPIQGYISETVQDGRYVSINH